MLRTIKVRADKSNFPDFNIKMSLMIFNDNSPTLDTGLKVKLDYKLFNPPFLKLPLENTDLSKETNKEFTSKNGAPLR